MSRSRIFEGPTSLVLLRGPDWAWIGLESKDGLNRLRVDLLEALDRLFIELRWTGARRVALGDAGWMEGQGRNFSAGADLHEVAELGAATADAFARRGQRILEHLAWPGWRSLTLLGGAALGGGCDLALAGQERWGVEPLKLAHPAASHGILTGFGGTVRLVETLGAEGADRLFRKLERWNAEQAFEAGAIQRKLRVEEVRAAVAAFLEVDGTLGRR